tara:strand:+ start:5742 stop:6005 length:264 start_codon:yes stop_codon:yes gene_type:complete
VAISRLAQPDTDRPLVDADLTQSVQMRTWTKTITDRSLIISTGSPEGVIEAPQGAAYMDDAGIASAILYIKRDADTGGDKTLGWILV